METQPVPLTVLRNVAPSAMDDFRVHAQAEIRDLLKQLMDGNVLLTISTPMGVTYTTTVWTMDTSRGTLSFAADATDPRMSLLLDADEAVAVGYLDSVKVQFDVNALVLVRGQGASVLNCEFPRELYRVQRREAYRVKPPKHTTPSARFIPRGQTDTIALRVLDVSLGGAALHLPPGMPAVEPGDKLANVMIELDGDTHLLTTLMVHHAIIDHREDHGARLGCEFVELSHDDRRALLRYIDQTQKRLRMMALRF